MKTFAQLERLVNEPKILRAVAELIGAGRIMVPAQHRGHYWREDQLGKIQATCDMGACLMKLGTVLIMPRATPYGGDHWSSGDTVPRVLDRNLKLLGGKTVQHVVIECNDELKSPTYRTIGYLFEIAEGQQP